MLRKIKLGRTYAAADSIRRSPYLLRAMFNILGRSVPTSSSARSTVFLICPFFNLLAPEFGI